MATDKSKIALTESQRKLVGLLIRAGLLAVAARLLPKDIIPRELLAVVLDETTQQILGGLIAMGVIVWSWREKRSATARVAEAENRVRLATGAAITGVTVTATTTTGTAATTATTATPVIDPED